MKLWLRRIGKWVGYPAFFLFTFLLFAYWTFPWDRVRDFIVQEVENPRGPGDRREPSGYQLEIVDLSPSWGTGVTLTGVRLVRMPTAPDERPVDVTFEEVNLRAGVLAALVGSLDLTFDAVVAGGEVRGSYGRSGNDMSIEAELENVNLRRVSILRTYVPLPMQGRLSGELELDLPEDPTNAQGRLGLELAGLKVGDGQAKLAFEGMGDGLTVEQIDAGDLQIAASVESGVLEIDRLTARGPDMQLSGAGQLRLLPRLGSSRLDLLLRLAFTEDYKTRSPRTTGLFMMLDNNVLVRAAKTDDGAYQIRLGGPLDGRIQPRAAGREPAPGTN